MTMPGDVFCRACGSALNVLSECPHGCRVASDEPLPDLRLVVADDDDEPEADPRSSTP